MPRALSFLISSGEIGISFIVCNEDAGEKLTSIFIFENELSWQGFVLPAQLTIGADFAGMSAIDLLLLLSNGKSWL
jgi:hypothetical protein